MDNQLVTPNTKQRAAVNQSPFLRQHTHSASRSQGRESANEISRSFNRSASMVRKSESPHETLQPLLFMPNEERRARQQQQQQSQQARTIGLLKKRNSSQRLGDNSTVSPRQSNPTQPATRKHISYIHNNASKSQTMLSFGFLKRAQLVGKFKRQLSRKATRKVSSIHIEEESDTVALSKRPEDSRDRHKIDLKQILKPFYLEDMYDEHGRLLPKKRSITPDKLLSKINPMPSKALQRKMDYFYFPYNKAVNYSKHMKFENDEKVDQLAKMKQLYNTPSLSTEDRVILHSVIRDINSGALCFDKKDSGWEKMFDFVINTEPARKQEIISQYKKILQTENQRKKAKKKKKKPATKALLVQSAKKPNQKKDEESDMIINIANGNASAPVLNEKSGEATKPLEDITSSSSSSLEDSVSSDSEISIAEKGEEVKTYKKMNAIRKGHFSSPEPPKIKSLMKRQRTLRNLNDEEAAAVAGEASGERRRTAVYRKGPANKRLMRKGTLSKENTPGGGSSRKQGPQSSDINTTTERPSDEQQQPSITAYARIVMKKRIQKEQEAQRKKQEDEAREKAKFRRSDSKYLTPVDDSRRNSSCSNLSVMSQTSSQKWAAIEARLKEEEEKKKAAKKLLHQKKRNNLISQRRPTQHDIKLPGVQQSFKRKMSIRETDLNFLKKAAEKDKINTSGSMQASCEKRPNPFGRLLPEKSRPLKKGLSSMALNTLSVVMLSKNKFKSKLKKNKEGEEGSSIGNSVSILASHRNRDSSKNLLERSLDNKGSARRKKRRDSIQVKKNLDLDEVLAVPIMPKRMSIHNSHSNLLYTNVDFKEKFRSQPSSRKNSNIMTNTAKEGSSNLPKQLTKELGMASCSSSSSKVELNKISPPKSSFSSSSSGSKPSSIPTPTSSSSPSAAGNETIKEEDDEASTTQYQLRTNKLSTVFKNFKDFQQQKHISSPQFIGVTKPPDLKASTSSDDKAFTPNQPLKMNTFHQNDPSFDFPSSSDSRARAADTPSIKKSNFLNLGGSPLMPNEKGDKNMKSKFSPARQKQDVKFNFNPIEEIKEGDHSHSGEEEEGSSSSSFLPFVQKGNIIQEPPSISNSSAGFQPVVHMDADKADLLTKQRTSLVKHPKMSPLNPTESPVDSTTLAVNRHPRKSIVNQKTQLISHQLSNVKEAVQKKVTFAANKKKRATAIKVGALGAVNNESSETTFKTSSDELSSSSSMRSQSINNSALDRILAHRRQTDVDRNRQPHRLADRSHESSSEISSHSSFQTTAIPTTGKARTLRQTFKSMKAQTIILTPQQKESSSSQDLTSTSKSTEQQTPLEGETQVPDPQTLADIIRKYETDRAAALDAKNASKPVFNNRCSKNHPLPNPELIMKGRIILPASSSAAIQKKLPAAAQDSTLLKSNRKFVTAAKSKEIAQKAVEEDHAYISAKTRELKLKERFEREKTQHPQTPKNLSQFKAHHKHSLLHRRDNPNLKDFIHTQTPESNLGFYDWAQPTLGPKRKLSVSGLKDYSKLDPSSTSNLSPQASKGRLFSGKPVASQFGEKGLFKNIQVVRPSKSIMREPFPSIKADGKVQRNIPGLKAEQALLKPLSQTQSKQLLLSEGDSEQPEQKALTARGQSAKAPEPRAALKKRMDFKKRRTITNQSQVDKLSNFMSGRPDVSSRNSRDLNSDQKQALEVLKTKLLTRRLVQRNRCERMGGGGAEAGAGSLGNTYSSLLSPALMGTIDTEMNRLYSPKVGKTKLKLNQESEIKAEPEPPEPSLNTNTLRAESQVLSFTVNVNISINSPPSVHKKGRRLLLQSGPKRGSLGSRNTQITTRQSMEVTKNQAQTPLSASNLNLSSAQTTERRHAAGSLNLRLRNSDFTTKPSVAQTSRQNRMPIAQECLSGEFKAGIGNLTDRRSPSKKSQDIEFNPEKKYQQFKQRKFKQGLLYASRGSMKKMIMNSENTKEMKAILQHTKLMAKKEEPQIELNLESSRERSSIHGEAVILPKKKSRNERRIGVRTFHK